MYKYKQTTAVEIGDLVIWTESENPFGLLTKNKVYQVTKRVDQDTVYVINDMGAEHWYCKALGFKVLQTKPASEAVVGDYMYRITSGSNAFPQHTINKITEIMPRYLYYRASERSVYHDEVIIIAQADHSLVQQVPTIPESAISFALYPSGAPSEPTQPTTKEQSMNKTTLKLLLELLGKDATNSKFVGIITNEDEYIGYVCASNEEELGNIMRKPENEENIMYTFKRDAVIKQKPRKIIIEKA